MKNRGKKIQRKQQNQVTRELRDNFRQLNVCIIGVPKERREEKGQKIFEEVMAKISKFDENYKPTDQRCSMNPKQYKQTYRQAHIIKLLKTKR